MDDALRAVAVRASEAGARVARDRFRTGDLDGEYGTDDVKTDLDREAEARIIEVIEETFPSHAIVTEESGYHDGSDYEWVVDPLDGTNNVAAGLPVFASAVSVRDDEGALVAAVHEPLAADTYVAERGAGATVNGEPIAAGSALPLDRATVSFIPGYRALGDADLRARADAMRDALDGEAKRVLSTWAPCVDWGLLARGRIEAVVTYHPDVYEQVPGTLLAGEAGAVGWADGPLAVHAATEELAETVVSILQSEPSTG
ncbi:inositol monophosphatase family protein [Natronomonas sp. EA1]|uniref:inositol monophosphatase family protein n=1 Tax=Natronomonas sp. EA1 TaxID=3421655 RepID=UPI003EC01446